MKANHIYAGAAQILHVKRQERNDHQQSDHVDERCDHQCEKLCGNFADFAIKNIKQRDRDRAEQHAHNRRLEGVRDIPLDQKHSEMTR